MPIPSICCANSATGLGTIIRRFHDFAAAEDAVQEALVAAAAQWQREGIPDNPRAWLIQVASRRMIDYMRSEAARRRSEMAVAMEVARAQPPVPDTEAERTTPSSCSLCVAIPR